MAGPTAAQQSWVPGRKYQPVRQRAWWIAPQNLSYSLYEAGGGNDWWNPFQPVMEVQSILGTPVG